MKTLLVTGGAGFIGSNFIRLLHTQCPDILIINLDLLTYAGNLENLQEVREDSSYIFAKGDICDRKLLMNLFEQYDFDAVVNFAAESHVDRSIENPEIFFDTNVKGTLALLDTSLHFWKNNPNDKYDRSYKAGVKFIQVSTDEVYGSLGEEGFFTETTPLAPNSPYSASKASADLLVRAYYETYGLPVNITRCSNNYGPYQFPEKLIPLMINNCVHNLPLPVYGNGKQIRDWLHVNDHCNAINMVLHKGMPGFVYNIGGGGEKTNIEIVKQILYHLQKPDSLVEYVKDRPGHDRRYAIDSSKISSELGWAPAYSFERGLDETIRWYLDHPVWIESVTSGSYQQYYDKMYGKASFVK